MKPFMNRWCFLLFVILATSLLASGCAGQRPEPGVVFPCVADDRLKADIAQEANLEEFSCVFQEWSGTETLHFKVAIKNVAESPQRFKVNIFLDNGKAVGGLIPRKTKKGLVNPGQTGTFVYPVNNMEKVPKAITLMVRTSS